MKKINLTYRADSLPGASSRHHRTMERILNVQGMKLRLVFHISREDSTYDAKMDSPDEKALGIPASATNFKNSTLNIDIAN